MNYIIKHDKNQALLYHKFKIIKLFTKFYVTFYKHAARAANFFSSKKTGASKACSNVAEENDMDARYF